MLRALFPENLPRGPRAWTIVCLACFAAVFALYTGYQGSLPAYVQRGVFFAIAFALIFLARPFAEGRYGLIGTVLGDVLPALVSVGVGLYFAVEYNNLVVRLLGAFTTADYLVAAAVIVCVLEATRRMLGRVLPLLALVFLGYAVFGSALPPPWGHPGFSLSRTITYLSLGLDGVFGAPLDAAATYVLVFVLLGGFLEATGAGDFVIGVSQYIFGRFRGGAAKVEVVASALFGTVSGSAVANVVGTGTFTIPLMKRRGYRPAFAAAVEAASSTGGQLMPPIMGAAAFIMAEFLGISYGEIALAATVPAILYFASCFFNVDLEAARHGLSGTTERPSLRQLADGWAFVIPIGVLIVLMFYVDYSPLKSAFFSILSLLAVSFVMAPRRFPARVMAGIRKGAAGLLDAAAATACAGIIVGVFGLTGLGLKLAGLLVTVAGGQLLILLCIVALACLLLGMGVPTTAAYIMVATMVAPALIQLGVLPLAAHLFVFYFAIVAVVTPPVAVAAYVAAGIAESDPWETGWLAARIALPGFLVPFVFVFRPGLLLLDDPLHVAEAVFVAVLGVWALAAATTGQMFRRMPWWQRAVAAGAGLILLAPGALTDLVGVLVLLGLVGVQLLRRRAQPSVPASSVVESAP